MPDQVMPELPYFYAWLSVVCAPVVSIKVQAGINAVINIIPSGLFIGNADMWPCPVQMEFVLRGVWWCWDTVLIIVVSQSEQ